MATEAAMEKVVKSLSFQVEAIPRQAVEASNSSNLTPVNVRVKVRKKHGSTLKKAVLIPKAEGPKDREKIRLASSDMTIMSFNMLMENDIHAKAYRKPKKNIFGGCLGAEYEDDEVPYMPNQNTTTTVDDTSIDSNTNSSISESVIAKKKLKLSKNVFEEPIPIRRPIFIGKCKPGGCLDPPFGEDRYPYMPNKTKDRPIDAHDVKKKPRSINNVVEPEIHAEKDKDDQVRKQKVQKLRGPTDISSSNDNISIQNIYHPHDLKNPLEDVDSQSIITYPPALSTSGLNIDEVNTKSIHNRRLSASSNRARQSFNEYSASYYSPRSSKDRDNDVKNKVRSNSMGQTVTPKSKPLQNNYDDVFSNASAPNTNDPRIYYADKLGIQAGKVGNETNLDPIKDKHKGVKLRGSHFLSDDESSGELPSKYNNQNKLDNKMKPDSRNINNEYDKRRSPGKIEENLESPDEWNEPMYVDRRAKKLRSASRKSEDSTDLMEKSSAYVKPEKSSSHKYEPSIEYGGETSPGGGNYKFVNKTIVPSSPKSTAHSSRKSSPDRNVVGTILKSSTRVFEGNIEHNVEVETRPDLNYMDTDSYEKGVDLKKSQPTKLKSSSRKSQESIESNGGSPHRRKANDGRYDTDGYKQDMKSFQKNAENVPQYMSEKSDDMKFKSVPTKLKSPTSIEDEEQKYMPHRPRQQSNKTDKVESNMKEPNKNKVSSRRSQESTNFREATPIDYSLENRNIDEEIFKKEIPHKSPHAIDKMEDAEFNNGQPRKLKGLSRFSDESNEFSGMSPHGPSLKNSDFDESYYNDGNKKNLQPQLLKENIQYPYTSEKSDNKELNMRLPTNYKASSQKSEEPVESSRATPTNRNLALNKFDKPYVSNHELSFADAQDSHVNGMADRVKKLKSNVAGFADSQDSDINRMADQVIELKSKVTGFADAQDSDVNRMADRVNKLKSNVIEFAQDYDENRNPDRVKKLRSNVTDFADAQDSDINRMSDRVNDLRSNVTGFADAQDTNGRRLSDRANKLKSNVTEFADAQDSDGNRMADQVNKLRSNVTGFAGAQDSDVNRMEDRVNKLKSNVTEFADAQYSDGRRMSDRVNKLRSNVTGLADAQNSDINRMADRVKKLRSNVTEFADTKDSDENLIKDPVNMLRSHVSDFADSQDSDINRMADRVNKLRSNVTGFADAQDSDVNRVADQVNKLKSNITDFADAQDSNGNHIADGVNKLRSNVSGFADAQDSDVNRMADRVNKLQSNVTEFADAQDSDVNRMADRVNKLRSNVTGFADAQDSDVNSMADRVNKLKSNVKEFADAKDPEGSMADRVNMLKSNVTGFANAQDSDGKRMANRVDMLRSNVTGFADAQDSDGRRLSDRVNMLKSNVTEFANGQDSDINRMTDRVNKLRSSVTGFAEAQGSGVNQMADQVNNIRSNVTEFVGAQDSDINRMAGRVNKLRSNVTGFADGQDSDINHMSDQVNKLRSSVTEFADSKDPDSRHMSDRANMLRSSITGFADAQDSDINHMADQVNKLRSNVTGFADAQDSDITRMSDRVKKLKSNVTGLADAQDSDIDHMGDRINKLRSYVTGFADGQDSDINRIADQVNKLRSNVPGLAGVQHSDANRVNKLRSDVTGSVDGQDSGSYHMADPVNRLPSRGKGFADAQIFDKTQYTHSGNKTSPVNKAVLDSGVPTYYQQPMNEYHKTLRDSDLENGFENNYVGSQGIFSPSRRGDNELFKGETTGGNQEIKKTLSLINSSNSSRPDDIKVNKSISEVLPRKPQRSIYLETGQSNKPNELGKNLNDMSKSTFPTGYNDQNKHRIPLNAYLNESDYNNIIPSSKLSPSISINLDLAFHNYTNDKNERVIRTLDSAYAAKHPSSEITFVKTCFRYDGETITFPIGYEQDMSIQLRKSTNRASLTPTHKPTTSIPGYDMHDVTPSSVKKLTFGAREERNIFDIDLARHQKMHGDDIKQGDTSKPTLMANRIMQAALTSVYEKQLVPLQNTIKSLKDEVDALSNHQVLVRYRLMVTKRLSHSNKRCGCITRKH